MNKRLWILPIVVLGIAAASAISLSAASPSAKNPKKLFLGGTTGSSAVRVAGTKGKHRVHRLKTDATALTNSDNIELNLFADRNFIAKRKREHKIGRATIWTGKLENKSDSEVTLVSQDNVVAGSIRTGDGEFYTIRQDASGNSEVKEVSQDLMPVSSENDTVTPSDQLTPPAPTGGLVSANATAGKTTLDILVVYTAEARAAAGGTTAITNLIQLAITEMNQVLENSQVDVVFRLVNASEAAPSANQAASSTYLSAITSDATIAALRNQYGADFVSVWVNGPAAGGGTVGIGWIMTYPSTSFQSAAFSVVEKNFANGPYYSFEHEIGHNMGSAHDRGNSSTPGSYSYSYGYQQQGHFFDIMSYSSGCSGCSRINYFSNPLVSYNGFPTGVDASQPNSADAAQTFQRNRVYAEQYRNAVTPTTPPTITSFSASPNSLIVGNSTTLSWAVTSAGSYTLDLSNVGDVSGTFSKVLSPATTTIYTLTATNSVGSVSSNIMVTVTPPSQLPPSPPSFVSMSPTSGSGTGTTFTFNFTDPNSALEISGVQLQISNSTSAVNACVMTVTPASREFYLLDTNGLGFIARVPFGSTVPVSNANCSVGPATSMTISGTNMAITMPITFTPIFAGAKNIYTNVAENNSWKYSPSLMPVVGSFQVAAVPVITQNPISQSAAAGQTAVFSMGATGATSYQWQSQASGVSGFTNISGAISASYTTPALTLSNSGTQYRCLVSNASGSTTSLAATLTVTPAVPIFTQHPQDMTVLAGQPAVFTIIATGATSYQWQSKNPSSVVFSTISGATAATYTTPATTISDSGTQYQCVATNSAGSATSNPATVTVTPNPPVISQHPQNVTVNSGQTATFTVVATNATSYQWQSQTPSAGFFSDISGATAASYTTPTTVSTNNGTLFRCKVSNSTQLIFSSSATLTVIAAPPTISQHPQSTTANVGQTASFSITAVNASTYQWQLLVAGGSGFTNISGATSATYVTAATTLSDSGSQYRCIVSNNAGSANSNPATLTVSPGTGAPPTAPTFKSLSPDNGAGTEATFTAVFTDLNGAAEIGRALININTSLSSAGGCYIYIYANTRQYYMLTSDGNGWIGPVTMGSGIGNNGNCTIGAASSINVSGTDLSVVLPIQFGAGFAGTKRIYTNVADLSGVWTSWTTAGSFTVGSAPSPSAPTISQHPQSATVIAGQTVSISVVASNATSYQWQALYVGAPSFTNILGATSASYTTPVLQVDNSGTQYRCVASNTRGGATNSNAATVTVNPLPPVVQSFTASPTTILGGNQSTLSWSVTGTTSVTITPGLGSRLGQDSTTVAPQQTTVYTLTATNASGSAVAMTTITVTMPPAPVITTQPQDSTARVGAFTDFMVLDNGGYLYQWQSKASGALSFTDIPGATTFRYYTPALTLADNNTQFRCIVGNLGGSTLSNVATLTVLLQNPVITQQPISQTVTAGQSATFTMTATNATSYQWESKVVGAQNFSDISGATLASYITPATTVSQSGTQFQCRAINSGGWVRSSSATLTVNTAPPASAPPTITQQPQNVSVTDNQTATFSVVATSATSYQWQGKFAASGSFINVPGAVSSSYTTSVVTSGMNGMMYRCVVTNSAGSTTSNSATLTFVMPPMPVVTQNPQNTLVMVGQPATFSVQTNTAITKYTWYSQAPGALEQSVILGANQATYTTPPTAMADSGTYFWCYVLNSAGQSNSSSALLTVSASVPPTITRQPASLWIVAGQTPPFSVVASSATSYQWQVKAPGVASYSNIAGATSASYTAPALSVSDNGIQYRVIATNLAGSDTSQAATVTVYPATTNTPTPPSFSSISPNNGSGPGATFSTVFVDPNGASEISTAYILISTNINSKNNCYLALYPDRYYLQSSTANVMLGPAPFGSGSISNGNCTIGTGSSVSVIGATMTFTVPIQFAAGFAGSKNIYTNVADMNNIPVTWTIAGSFMVGTSSASPPPTPPTVTQHPQNATVTAGQTASFAVIATNATSYQWQSQASGAGSFSNISGATSSSYTTGTLAVSNSGTQFRCVATNATGSTNSNAATLTVNAAPVPPTISAFSASPSSIVSGNSSTLSWTVTGATSLSIDQTIGAVTGTSRVVSPTQTTIYTLSATNSVGTVTALSTVTVTVPVPTPSVTTQPQNTTVTSGQSATFSITASNATSYQWQSQAPGSGSFANITGATSPSYTTGVMSVSNSGTQFRCMAISSAGSVTSSAATLTVNAAPTNLPVITMFAPDAYTVPVGSAFLISWSVSNFTTLSIDQNIGNVTTYGGYRASVRASGPITYTMTATNANGSSTASFTINQASSGQAPVITQNPNSQSVNVGQTATFSFAATGATSYQWKSKSSSASVFTAITGATGASYTTPVSALADNGTQYQCTASNATGSATSVSATLTVTAPPPSVTVPVILAFSATPTTISQGNSVTLAWNVTGATSLSIDNAIGSVLGKTSISATPTTNTMYTLSATNSAGTVTARTSVTVTAPPTTTSPITINNQPVDATVSLNERANFSVYATGPNPITGYQWYENDVAINRAIYYSYSTLFATQAMNGYRYYVIVTDSQGNTVKSRTATLSVFTPNSDVQKSLSSALSTVNGQAISQSGSLTLSIAPISGAIYTWLITPISSVSGRTSGADLAPGESNAATISLTTNEPVLDLKSLGLTTGKYSVQVRVMSSGVAQSSWMSAQISVVGVSLNSLKLYPNPWKSDRHAGHPVTFDGLPANCTIKIFTVSGRLVKTLSAPTSPATWNLDTDSGDQAASGIYLYLITDTQGNKTKGKLAVVR